MHKSRERGASSDDEHNKNDASFHKSLLVFSGGTGYGSGM
jgi:hypothetical protein